MFEINKIHNFKKRPFQYKICYKKKSEVLRNLCHKKDMSLELLIKDAHIMTPAFRIPKERQYKASMYEFEKCWGPFKASW